MGLLCLKVRDLLLGKAFFRPHGIADHAGIVAQLTTVVIALVGESAMAGAIGAEYAFNDLLFLRVGYRVAGESAVIPSHLALGLGLQFQGFRADVSYLAASPILGNTLTIGIAFRF